MKPDYFNLFSLEIHSHAIEINFLNKRKYKDTVSQGGKLSLILKPFYWQRGFTSNKQYLALQLYFICFEWMH